MKIAVISDIHDNANNLFRFFEQVKKYSVEKILFLWDLSSAFIAKILSESDVKVFSILWNNNWDICRVKEFENDNFYQSSKVFDFFEVDWRKIFLSHYDEIAIPIAKSWEFDAVFYWHNHDKHKELIWNCLLLNPWEVWAYKTGVWTYAIYDTQTNDAEIIDIENSITTNII